MRILHIADVNPSPDSGAAGTEYETVRALSQAGHVVRTVWADELSHRIKHFNLRYVFELPQSLRKVMQEYLAKEPFDIVQISQPHGYLAAKALRDDESSTRFVHRSHGFEPRAKEEEERWHRAYPEGRSLTRQIATGAMNAILDRNNNAGIARYADGHLVSATECAEYLQTYYSVGAERIATIPQGIPQTFCAGATPIDAERKSRLLYVGQFTFIKAPMVLGQIVSALLGKYPSLRFTWVCAEKHHQDARATLDPKVVSQVTLLDWMPQQQLLSLYNSHGIFLFPSFFEGFGKAFLEAMSRGLVVVASRNGGMKDIIADGINGFTVDTGNVSGFVIAVEAVLNDANLARTISERAIASTCERQWSKYAEECTAFYECLRSLPKIHLS